MTGPRSGPGPAVITRGGWRQAGPGLVDWADRPDKAVEALSKYGGTVLKTSLSREGERELQEALHGGAQ